MQPLEDIQSNFSTVSASLQPPTLPVSSSAGPSNGKQEDPWLTQYYVEDPPPSEQSFVFCQGVIMCAEDNCEETFQTISKGNKHRDKHIKRIRCELCTHRTATRTDIRIHLDTHRPSSTRMLFPCSEPDCNKTFTKKWSLVRHLEKKHGKSREDSSLS